MKKMKKTVWALLSAAFCAFGAFAESGVTVTGVTAQQRYPWNGKVDIVVSFACAAGDLSEVECFFAATNSATKAAIPVEHLTLNGDDTGSGATWTRKYIWDAAADAGHVKIADVALTADARFTFVQLWENGPYWATCNVGATKPEEYGYYFWWGDTVGYKRNAANSGWVSVKDGSSFSFDSSHCPTYNKTESQLRSAGYIDSAGNLTAAHDAATAHLGASWRMPTDAEFSALISNCTTSWTTRNGVYGRLVKGKGDYASKSIFLPVAGYGYDSGFNYLGSLGYYWSSSPSSVGSRYAWSLLFGSGIFDRIDNDRYYGRSVRPVRGFATDDVAFSSVTTHLALDCTVGTRTADSAGERLYYDAGWVAGGATAQVYEGSTLLASGSKGSVLWQPKTCSNENIALTVNVLNSSGSVVATETALFLFPHSEKVTTTAKAATCTTAGCTKGSYCTRCNAILSESVTIPAHNTAEGSWPEGEEEIYDRAFEGCELLQRIDLSRNVKLKRIGKRAFADCWDLEEIVLPPNLEVIDEEAFAGCSFVSRIVLPPSVVEIGAGAFSSCTSLASIVIPDAVTSIGAYCFYNCLSLHDVTLSQRLTELPDYTFHWCWNLDSFTVPASVTRLGRNLVTSVYYQGVVKGPREIYFLGNAPAYDADTYSGAMDTLTTYIKYNSRGWDGRPSSRDIPEAWPTIGSSRGITYWVARQFDVSYQANGGTFVENGATAYDCLCTTTELYAVPPGNPQRAGFRFAGWWTEPNGGTQITASTPVVLTKAHTLYAHWEAAVTVTVRFNANGGTVKPGEKICVAGETFGQLPVPTREHFAFDGWYTQARGGYQVLPATEVPQADRELFAHWVEATYVVRFHSNDGRDETYDQYYTYGSSFNLATCRFTNGRSQFSGWARTAVGSVAYAENALFKDFGAIEADIVHLYAVWIGDSYVIRFDSNGGDGAMDNQTINVGETKPLDPNVFTRTGWYFIGWSTAYNGSVVYKDGASVKDLTTAKDVVILYAVWQRMPANTYQVIFADGAKRSTEFYAANRVYELPTGLFTPPSDKRLAGWAGSNGRRYDPGVLVFNLVPVGGTIALTAIWE